MRRSKTGLYLGCCAAALASFAASAPAHAATVGPITITQVVEQNNRCEVFASFTVTGTTDDTGNNQDAIGWRVTDVNGFGNATALNQGVTPGQTVVVSNVLAAVFANSVNRRELFFRVYDMAGFTSNPSFNDVVQSAQIDRADLIAAGGRCAFVATNDAPAGPAIGDQSVPEGAQVTIDAGTYTDGDNDPLTYSWTQTGGPSLSLGNPQTSSIGFTAPQVTQPTQYTFEVQISDGLDTVVDVVTVLVSPSNVPPLVQAMADVTVDGDTPVSLTATASDDDNDPLTYEWVQTGGTSVSIADGTTLNASFTAPPRGFADQVLTFEVRASDGTDSSNDTVTVTVRGNQAPTAAATAPASGTSGQVIQLDGSGSSDPENDDLIYQWTQTGGPSVTITNPGSPVASFEMPLAANSNQTYTFQLLVADTFDAVGTTTVSVTQSANGGPIADAGADQTVSGSAAVALDGSGSSDPDNDPLFYEWEQIGGTGVTLSATDIVNPTFTAPAATGQAQTLEFRLTVRDRAPVANARVAPTNSDSDTVVITIAANRPPVAEAGPSQGPINGGETVTLDGTGSTDPDGDTLTYSWTQISGTSVTLSDASAAQPSFTAPNSNETLAFRLTVSDGTLSTSDTVEVAVQATGSVTIIQQVTGSDTDFAFTSDIAALNATLTTSGGTGQLVAANVVVGSYTVTAPDLTAQGYAVTDISCNDSDSTVNLANRSVALELAAGEDLVCTFTAANTREAAVAAIYNFLTARNALILSHQPDLQRRLDRLAGNPAGSGSVSAFGVTVPGSQHLPVNASLTRDAARFETSLAMAMGPGGNGSERVFDLWSEAYFSRATIGSQEADFSIIYLGADLRLSDSVLVGGLVSWDEFSDRDGLAAGEAEGEGWMAGPYVTVKLAPQLFAEARAAWGTSDNRVSPLAGQVDDFETSRSLYSGSLIGQFDLDGATQFRPELTLRYISEDQSAYTDAMGVTVPGQVVDQGDISLRPRISHLVDMGSGWALRPFAELEGIYTFGTAPDTAVANLLPNSLADVFGDFRGRVEGGADLFTQGSFRASLSAFYDGIGADDFENAGLHVGVSFGF